MSAEARAAGVAPHLLFRAHFVIMPIAQDDGSSLRLYKHSARNDDGEGRARGTTSGAQDYIRLRFRRHCTFMEVSSLPAISGAPIFRRHSASAKP